MDAVSLVAVISMDAVSLVVVISMDAVSLVVVVSLDAFSLAVIFLLPLLREGRRVLQASTSSGHPEEASQGFPLPLWQCFPLHSVEIKFLLLPPGVAVVFVKAVSDAPYGFGQIQFEIVVG